MLIHTNFNLLQAFKAVVGKKAVERVSKTLDTTYAPVTPEQILENTPRLTDSQKTPLKDILVKHIKLFDGTLGM